ncbi:glutathione peroxidase [Rhodonellum psychrophilum GCM71 = DSM 17998]|uniref:Glutathione peroxidase n=2 Tax=Rhodonellum TaxID=336827 RepID=U5BWI1_9BACT|nr:MULTISPECIES: glutathione peroxidase [Rhodonellum]ERM80961.1 glutathione peroxidase [Rhodonellum psychrophilum GCM71 = DSM 17998]MDO9554743.1 glutathione peroxidase [Rhodonellum sp.]SDY82276.1 glutathione peroxidase [Rhodonellum ikkaensis]
MKAILTIFTLIALACTSSVQKQIPVESGQAFDIDQTNMEKSFYDFKMKDIDGNEVDFNQYKGKKILLVNVASKCGYTPQYEQLQELNETYGDKVVILGFPANNFGGQESGTNEEIKQFCTSNFGVTFQMFDKISVKGIDKHPLYRWLSDKSQNGWNDKEPSWNFCKYFINEKGELKQFFSSSVNPLDEEIIKLIEA